ncbi:MAG: thiamine pyrophosphate-dependent dehydrogenase E1 component subunit alpha [Parvibaculaceae bacterium]
MTTNLPAERLLDLYRCMKLIRLTEERLAEDCANGKLPGPVHLYIGQEAVAAGVCGQLSNADWIASTHRGHGHFLAKGGSVEGLMAEIYGRETGICKGFGGSMHVTDLGKGMMGANGIVGGGIALMTGAALAAQLDGKGGVAVCFFGDGAANQGVLAEALNVSALWRLPLLLVCEHNGFSEFSPAATVTAGDIYRRATAYGVSSERVDGNDIVAVWQAADRALQRARRGEGPTLIEASTYRIRGHVEYENTFLGVPYRSEEEVATWRGKDPIEAFKRHLLGEDLVPESDLKALDEELHARVSEAVAQAEAAPWPEPRASPKELMFA